MLTWHACLSYLVMQASVSMQVFLGYNYHFPFIVFVTRDCKWGWMYEGDENIFCFRTHLQDLLSFDVILLVNLRSIQYFYLKMNNIYFKYWNLSDCSSLTNSFNKDEEYNEDERDVNIADAFFVHHLCLHTQITTFMQTWRCI